MSKKKKKNKKKQPTLKELKDKLENIDTNLEVAKKVGFEMIKGKSQQVIDPKEKAERKEKKHKKDYRYEE